MLTCGDHIRLTTREQSLLDHLTRTGVKPRTRAELERALDDAHKAWNAAAPACPEAQLMAALALDFKKAF
jgi:hypothetical protein